MLQLAGFAPRLGLAGIWWRQPPYLGECPQDVTSLLDDLQQAGAGARVGVIAEVGAGRADRISNPALPPAVPAIIVGSPRDLAAWRRNNAGNQAISLLAVTGSPATVGAGPRTGAFLPVRTDRNLEAELAAVARRISGRQLFVEVCVSVGRTTAEAAARADRDVLFHYLGHPSEQGLFGTLEHCQQAAAALSRAGVTELICHVPLAVDLPDVLAQLCAVNAVGPDILRPDGLPSPAPAPPAGWGGRRRQA